MLTRRDLPGDEPALSNVHARAFSLEGSPGFIGEPTLVDDPPAPERWLPCQIESADLWFAEHPDELGRAQQLCQRCPILAPCLEGAVRRGEPWGVWGGEIFDRGQIILFKRRRGHPVKPTPSAVNERGPQVAWRQGELSHV